MALTPGGKVRIPTGMGEVRVNLEDSVAMLRRTLSNYRNDLTRNAIAVAVMTVFGRTAALGAFAATVLEAMFTANMEVN